MQYELQKLERMTLDEVREIAVSMGLKPRRSQSLREISYAILDAQADNRAAVIQAKEDAREAAGLPSKRERARGVKRNAAKVNTSNLKSGQVLATVGSEKEEMAKMQEDLKANNHKPNKTVIAAKPMAEDVRTEAVNAEQAEVPTPAQEPQAANEAPVVEQPAKKRGRPKKVQPEAATVAPEEAPVVKEETPVAQEEIPFEQEEEKEETKFVMPDLGENVIAMGTLEVAPDGYGFLRSADYNYLPSPDDVYVSKDQVRQYGLKPGDTVECSIRVNPQPDKFFPMDKVIRINGLSPELAKRRVAFENLTPLFPDQKFKRSEIQTLYGS